jgi:hypothetical protein
MSRPSQNTNFGLGGRINEKNRVASERFCRRGSDPRGAESAFMDRISHGRKEWEVPF